MQSASTPARRSVAERSIRVLVSPVPITFTERRSVLQVLEQFGPVEVFKMTPGYHANFVSVTNEPTTAARLIASSPLTYRLPMPRLKTNVDIADLVDDYGGSKLNTVGNRPSITHSREDPATEDISNARGDNTHSSNCTQYKLEIFPAPDYYHKFAMSGSPLHQSWPGAHLKDKSFVASTLKQSLPQTMPAKGLAHWLFDTGSHTSKADRKAERLQLKSWLPSKMNES